MPTTGARPGGKFPSLSASGSAMFSSSMRRARRRTIDMMRASLVNGLGATLGLRPGERAGTRTIFLLLVVCLLGIASGAYWFYRASQRGAASAGGPASGASGIVLSDSTTSILAGLESSLEIRFYALLDPATVPASVTAFAGRVGQLLSEYQKDAPGKIKVTSFTSQSNSDANAAMADGITVFNLDKGEACYLGITLALNGRKETLPHLSPDWEQALEPDLSHHPSGGCNPRRRGPNRGFPNQHGCCPGGAGLDPRPRCRVRAGRETDPPGCRLQRVHRRVQRDAGTGQGSRATPRRGPEGWDGGRKASRPEAPSAGPGGADRKTEGDCRQVQGANRHLSAAQSSTPLTLARCHPFLNSDLRTHSAAPGNAVGVCQPFSQVKTLGRVRRGGIVIRWLDTAGHFRRVSCGRYGERDGASFFGAPLLSSLPSPGWPA